MPHPYADARSNPPRQTTPAPCKQEHKQSRPACGRHARARCVNDALLVKSNRPGRNAATGSHQDARAPQRSPVIPGFAFACSTTHRSQAYNSLPLSHASAGKRGRARLPQLFRAFALVSVLPRSRACYDNIAARRQECARAAGQSKRVPSRASLLSWAPVVTKLQRAQPHANPTLCLRSRPALLLPASLRPLPCDLGGRAPIHYNRVEL